MTQKEFQDLTGIQISLEQYEVINGMYMCEENMDKQTFCKMFKKMNLMEHVDYVVKVKEEVKEGARSLRQVEFDNKKIVEEHTKKEEGMLNQIADLEQDRHDFEYVVVEKIHNYKTDELLAMVRERMGIRPYYEAVLAMGCNPTKADLEIFVQYLNDKEFKQNGTAEQN